MLPNILPDFGIPAVPPVPQAPPAAQPVPQGEVAGVTTGPEAPPAPEAEAEEGELAGVDAQEGEVAGVQQIRPRQLPNTGVAVGGLQTLTLMALLMMVIGASLAGFAFAIRGRRASGVR
jgi:hypothetical protein